MSRSSFRFATALVFLSLFACAAFAQVWPLPASQPGVPTLCSACPVPEKDKPTWPYNDPVLSFTGRYLDSLYVQDWQQTFRTARATEVVLMPALDRVYLQIGHAVASYKLSTFFNRLENRETLVKATSYPGNRRISWQDETWLGWDTYFYAENKATGWTAPVIDGQDRLYRFDVDDRGYVYMAYSVFGWGIAQDVDKGKGLMANMYQEYPHPQFPAQFVMALKSATGRYYSLISGPGAVANELFDTTDPAHPQKLADLSPAFYEMAKGDTATAGIISSNAKLAIYDTETLLARGAASKIASAPGNAQYVAVTSDGPNFYAIFKTAASALGISAFVRQPNGTYTQVDYAPGTAFFNPYTIRYGDGYLAVTGFHSGGDLRLFKLNGGVPVEIDTNDYFYKYYSGVVGYARPPIAAPQNAVTVRYNGRLYLIVPAFGLGDVYQLKGGDYVAVLPQGAVGEVNPNAEPRQPVQVFYGDRVGFTTSSETPKTLTWTFGNPEATGDPNTTTSGVGTVVTHQYSGLTPATLGGARQVTATDTNNVSTSVTVVLKAPRARFGVSGAPSLVFSQANANSAAPIVAGDKFFDASDGDVEGHYASWNIDGSQTRTRPYTATGQHLVPVGACGAHVLGFDAFYGPHNPATFTTIGPDYQVSLLGPGHDFRYEVRPFAAAIDAPSANGSNVTFTSASRSTSDTAVLPAHPQALSWQWDLVDAQENVLFAGPTGFAANAAAVPSWTVARSRFTARNMRVRLILQTSQPLGGGCGAYATSRAFTATLNGPDPAITGGCNNGASPCTFFAGSASGANTVGEGWTYAWSVQPANLVSEVVSNAATYSPNFSQTGVYTVSVTVNNAIGTQTATKNVIVTQAGSSCMTMSANTVFIHFNGPSSGCDEFTPNCSGQDNLPFTVRTFGGYEFGCAPHTFQWNFGDGTTASGKDVAHKYTVAGAYDVTCTISNSAQTFVAQQRVVVAGGVPSRIFPDVSFTLRGFDGQPKTFTFTPLVNPATTIVKWSWDFGDGQTVSANSGADQTHTYADYGLYQVTLTVEDAQGPVKTFARQVVVQPPHRRAR